MTLSANQMEGLVTALAPAGEESGLVARMLYKTYYIRFADGGTAGNGQLISPIVTFDSSEFPNGVLVIRAKVAPSVAVTGHDTNNKVFTLTKVASDGTGSTSVGTLTTNVATGNFAAHQAKEMTLTGSATRVDAGGSLLLTMAAGGTGVAVAGATGGGIVTVTVKAL